MKSSHAAQSIVITNHFKILVRFHSKEHRWVDLKNWLAAVSGTKSYSNMNKLKIENGDLVFLDRKITGPTLYHMGDPVSNMNEE